MKFADLTGQRIGRLVCLERIGKGRNRRTLWRCQCDCGNEKIAAIGDLRKAQNGLKGGTASCGCFRSEAATATLRRTVGVKARACRICERPIPPTPGKHKTTCSDECEQESDRRRRKAAWARMTPAQRDAHCKKVCAAQKEKFAGERTCKFCGKIFIGAPKRKFCNRECLENWIKTGDYRQRHMANKAAIELARTGIEIAKRMGATRREYRGHAFTITPRPQGFAVEFREFPTIITSGETLDEAVKNAREALSLHLEAMRALK